MRLKRFSASIGLATKTDFEISFSKNEEKQKNFFSVLIGSNGTQKSRTLRAILDLGIPMAHLKLTNRKARAGLLELWDTADDNDIISKVIAVSGVATDRFPSRITLRGGSRPRATYRYIGPRTDNNLVSRAQGINQIAASLLESPDRIRSRFKNLKYAFSILKVTNGIFFSFSRSIPDDERWTLKKITDRMADSKLEWSKLDSNEIDELSASCLKIMKSRQPLELRLDLDDEVRIDSSVGDLKTLYALLNCGFIAVEESYTYNDLDSEILQLSEFSSGQWHIFSSLLFTAIAVENNTLILIDEPENSLHPEWQQQYLRLMRNVISSSSGVHIIVATHSPLIAASLDPTEAEVIKLRRNLRGRLNAQALKSGPFGWTSDEILQEVFGLESSRSIEFTNRMDAALGLFAKGDRENPKLKRLVRSLQRTLPDLPPDDIARKIIETLLIVLESSEAK
ncbi:AAA family ATPase [Pseudomonas fluorescens]|uniref:AAA family ATPase n=1 Tax=Pseudomonas fluorescens TaxID=294 RepID=UPI001BD9AECD|nr:ATP-binding protein [Pseudomonas fluorescens]MBT0622534.1 AAA family ATPase [Pseudomonas fluorescens]